MVFPTNLITVPHAIRILNISRGGCRLATEGVTLQQGEIIAVAWDNQQWRIAKVVWLQSTTNGCEFWGLTNLLYKYESKNGPEKGIGREKKVGGRRDTTPAL